VRTALAHRFDDARRLPHRIPMDAVFTGDDDVRVEGTDVIDREPCAFQRCRKPIRQEHIRGRQQPAEILSTRLGLDVDGILQKPLKHSRRSADYDRDKDHHKTHGDAAGNVILAAHSDEQVSDRPSNRSDKRYGAIFYDP
jgi:hypothetical protein